LAPLLARAGFDVYVPDLRGHGRSRPAVHRQASYGHAESVTEDIPTVLRQIVAIRGDAVQHWIAHSWGGVMLLSHFARCSEYRHLVRSMVCFGSRRELKAPTWQKRIIVDLLWKRAMYPLAALLGYAPMRAVGFGSDNETRASYVENRRLLTAPWIDPHTGFDYAEALRRLSLPPMLHVSGAGDTYLGHRSDIERLIGEVGAAQAEHWHLATATGALHNYDHVNMLTHPDAARDHFPKIIEWLRQHNV
jgi:predicted alpha/beta hydrolase